MTLKSKVIIVTGGCGLLGKSIIEHLSKEGAIAINVDIAHTANTEVTNINADITSAAGVDELLCNIEERYGKIDGIVNNAYPRTSDWGLKFEDVPFDSWKRNIDLQLNSVFYMCQQVSEIMKKHQSGSIVNMASVYGMVGPDFSIYQNTAMTMPSAYSAIKGGLINFTKYLASYLGRYNIRVNAVSPGGIFDNQNEVFVQNYEMKVPLGRMGQPKDIAPAVCFLLSDEAEYITGHNLVIDGGWTAI